MDVACDEAQQRTLAGAIAADDPDTLSGRDANTGPVEDGAPGDAVSEVIDGQHDARFETPVSSVVKASERPAANLWFPVL